MPEQRLHSALAPIDVLTRLELEAELNKHADDLTRSFYRGVDYYRRIDVPNTGTYTSPPVPEGYVWSVRHVGVVLSAADQVIMTLGDTAQVTATPSGLPGILGVFPQGTNAIPYAANGFSDDQIILNPGEQFSLAPFTGSHTILGVLFISKQTPAEMKGKL
jgi:hypothetical protein